MYKGGTTPDQQNLLRRIPPQLANRGSRVSGTIVMGVLGWNVWKPMCSPNRYIMHWYTLFVPSSYKQYVMKNNKRRDIAQVFAFHYFTFLWCFLVPAVKSYSKLLQGMWQGIVFFFFKRNRLSNYTLTNFSICKLKSNSTIVEHGVVSSQMSSCVDPQGHRNGPLVSCTLSSPTGFNLSR